MASATMTDTPGAQTAASWAEDTIWWHIYPLGFCGAPIRVAAEEWAAEPTPRLRRLINWLDYASNLGINGLLLGPIFASQSHGYDTLDHFKIDPRLGTEQDFIDLISACQERGIRVVLDGVFSHVGDQHPWLRDDLNSKPGTNDLFDIDWNAPGGPKPRVWEGHSHLARLNHNSETAVNYVVSVMTHWLERGIDGWRLDAAYSVPREYWRKVLPRVREQFPETWFLGEVIHGDYAGYVANAQFNTVTQYEIWKAVWSAIRDRNLFELDWTMQRHNELMEHFTPQTFIGNHDVTRIATQVGDTGAIVATAVLMTIGGIPSIYAGDEQGLLGLKENRLGGDDAIRPEFAEQPGELDSRASEVHRAHRELISLRRRNPWLATAMTTKQSLANTNLRYRASARHSDDWLDIEIDLDAGRVVINDSDGVIWAHNHN